MGFDISSMYAVSGKLR